MSDDNIIEVSDLHFAYGQRQILKGLDLRIPRGKLVAILGTSGCGKSTLLRLIGGQLQPARGRVLVDGEDVHALDNAGLYRLRRKMGMMFQVSGLFSDLSVFENVAFSMPSQKKNRSLFFHPINMPGQPRKKHSPRQRSC